MSEIFERLSPLFRFKILRYLAVGAVGASIDIAIFSIATYLLLLPWLLSSIISSLVSTLAGYYLSIRFVFKSGVCYKQYQEISGVFLISFIAFSMHQFLLYFFIEILNINMIIAKIITIGLIFFFNYFSRSMIIFRRRF
jgi:putative flippase GtrA